VPAEARTGLPDSLVLLTADARLLVRSGAVVESLRRTGGVGRALASVAGLLPPALADRLYDRLARVRRLVFRAPADACPVADPARRARFLP
jgi:predicted DCC family thiol-disulfide oxidoreductase YuxK